MPPPQRSTLFPYTTLFRSIRLAELLHAAGHHLRRQSEFRRQLFLLRSEEHTSELQSRFDLVCRLLLEKKKHAAQSVGDSKRLPGARSRALLCRLGLLPKRL